MSVRVRVKFCGDAHYSLGYVSGVFEDGRVNVTFDGWEDGNGTGVMKVGVPLHVQDFEPDQVEFECVIDALARLA